jgi:hypothetical protein
MYSVLRCTGHQTAPGMLIRMFFSEQFKLNKKKSCHEHNIITKHQENVKISWSMDRLMQEHIVLTEETA